MGMFLLTQREIAEVYFGGIFFFTLPSASRHPGRILLSRTRAGGEALGTSKRRKRVRRHYSLHSMALFAYLFSELSRIAFGVKQQRPYFQLYGLSR
jgi:hypothetical protein